jgi:hypothetical protein
MLRDRFALLITPYVLQPLIKLPLKKVGIHCVSLWTVFYNGDLRNDMTPF